MTELERIPLTQHDTVFGLMGAARGLDEGLIGTSASLPSFQRLFGLTDAVRTEDQQAELLGNIASKL
jgi:hypothetical protein